MAIGDVDTTGDLVEIELLASATATSAAPSADTDGLPVSALVAALGLVPPTITIHVYSTAGSSTMNVTLRLWGYAPGAAKWAPLGPGAGSTKGLLNEGNAIDEGPTADVISHMEAIDLPGHVDRLYLQVTAINGTSTAVTADVMARRLIGGR